MVFCLAVHSYGRSGALPLNDTIYVHVYTCIEGGVVYVRAWRKYFLLGRCPKMKNEWNKCKLTAPTAKSEASVMMRVGACGFGCAKRVALARASFIAEKAAVACSSHGNWFAARPVVLKRLLSGLRMAVQLGRKR